MPAASCPLRVTVTSSGDEGTVVALDSPGAWLVLYGDEVMVGGRQLRPGAVLLLEPGA